MADGPPSISDIVERLRAARREAPYFVYGGGYGPDPLCQEAADEIERLRLNHE